MAGQVNKKAAKKCCKLLAQVPLDIISGFKQTVATVTTPIYWVNGVARLLTYAVPYGNSSRATGVALDGDDLYITGNDINEAAPYWKNGVAVALKSDGDRGAFAFGICIK